MTYRQWIEKLIFPVDFYHDKAKHLRAFPATLAEHFPEVFPPPDRG